MKRIMLAGALVLGLGCDLSQVQQPAAQPAPALEKKAEPKTIEGISPADLLAAYKENEVAADNKYKGKTVVITDVRIKSISKDFLDKPFLVLASGRQFEDFQAYFDPRFEKQLLDLKAGQVVNVGGRVDGLLMGSVIIRGAQIVQSK